MKHTGIYLDLPIKTVSEINRHEHWRARQRRVKAQRKEINAEWKNAVRGEVNLPCRVVLTRIAPKLLDDDNLRSACKAVRDEIAWLIGRDDNPSSPITWEYQQKAVGKREYRVLIEVQSL